MDSAGSNAGAPSSRSRALSRFQHGGVRGRAEVASSASGSEVESEWSDSDGSDGCSEDELFYY